MSSRVINEFGSPTKTSAAVLAGGNSGRYGGCPKGLLMLPGGRSIIERTVSVIASAGISDIVICSNDPRPYRHLRREIVPDRRAGVGPLAGLEAALLHYRSRSDYLLILPCDLPAITERELLALQAGMAKTDSAVAVAVTPDRLPHPLCAVISTKLAGAVSRAIDEGRRGVGKLWRSLDAHLVHFSDPAPFFNVNTPEDWHRWLLQTRFAESARSFDMLGGKNLG
jgi:molybdopterin-guanine dinucleotide biosynthesis protein A